MYARRVDIVGLRCFENTGALDLGPRCNLFVGPNNSGKSTILRAVLSLQIGQQLNENDIRAGETGGGFAVEIVDVASNERQWFAHQPGGFENGVHASLEMGTGAGLAHSSFARVGLGGGNRLFHQQRPLHGVVPLLARRKASVLNEAISLSQQSYVTGTFDNLVSRIDRVATDGPDHEAFKAAVRDVLGLPITTAASVSGKVAGIHLDRNRFITLDQMGDGVTEMVGLIVELVGERGKIFALEEPETNLHPRGLKALLDVIREASKHNQFLIATHSNIVLRELGADPTTKIFRVRRDGNDPLAPSSVEECPQRAEARTDLLRELGYEFGDLGLHDAWLFLEEASAETIVNQVLVPKFAPRLVARLRTFSSAGVSELAASVDSFARLVTFVHLEPAYRGRLWVRADAGPDGTEQVEKLRKRFDWLTEDRCAMFPAEDFERYYPSTFSSKVAAALATPEKQARRAAKKALLAEVCDWTIANEEQALEEWEIAAAEPIALLRAIESELIETGRP
ncbi:MAG TPA: hypothetical protein DHW63_10180 [Hyphomonadaceae bacterium]|nr:hypothetical protein [Hyphomonadaceae bacterium]